MTGQMRLAWPVEDLHAPRLQLYDEAAADVPNVLAERGYQAAGPPHDFELTDGRGVTGLDRRDQVIVCVVDVISIHATPTQDEEAA
jgi:hypothetical protein